MDNSTEVLHKIYAIHGYATPRLTMYRICNSLKKENYHVQNYSYSSITKNLDVIGRKLYEDIKKENLSSVSFVTHSMGALVVRSMLQFSPKDPEFPKIFRIVMIAPPNKGAEIADFYSSIPLLKYLTGPNVALMRTDRSSYANNLPKPTQVEIGIILGEKGNNRGFNPFIKGDNDGLLTPERTSLGIEKECIALHYEHLMLTQVKKVREYVLNFIKFGSFQNSKAK